MSAFHTAEATFQLAQIKYWIPNLSPLVIFVFWIRAWQHDCSRGLARWRTSPGWPVSGTLPGQLKVTMGSSSLLFLALSSSLLPPLLQKGALNSTSSSTSSAVPSEAVAGLQHGERETGQSSRWFLFILFYFFRGYLLFLLAARVTLKVHFHF